MHIKPKLKSSIVTKISFQCALILTFHCCVLLAQVSVPVNLVRNVYFESAWGETLNMGKFVTEQEQKKSTVAIS